MIIAFACEQIHLRYAKITSNILQIRRCDLINAISRGIRLQNGQLKI